MAAIIRQKRWTIALACVKKAENEKLFGYQRIIGVNDAGVITCEYISRPEDTDHAGIERLVALHRERNETIFWIGSKPNTVL